MIPGATRTAFDDLKLDRLPNWGRWGRQDSCRPDPQRVGSTIARFVKDDPDKDYEGVPEPAEIPIDHRDAERLDGFILRLPSHHKDVIRRHYYRNQCMPRLLLDQAVRALAWSIEEGR